MDFAHQTSMSSYRVPTPPRIVVPPPRLNSNALPEIPIAANKSLPFADSSDYEDIIKENAVLEWTYGRRREAQLILPYLFLGPVTIVKNHAWLKTAGVTCVVGVWQEDTFTSRFMSGPLQQARTLGIETHAVVLRVGNQDLIHSFPSTTKLISDHVEQRYHETGKIGKVLIFCESGNERSAAVVAAYLMETHVDFDYIRAIQLCQAQRFCVNFDDGLKSLLQSYWDILRAKRKVAEGTSMDAVTDAGTHESSRTTKRGWQRDEDEDMSGVEQDDEERFGGRNFAPFTDVPL